MPFLDANDRRAGWPPVAPSNSSKALWVRTRSHSGNGSFAAFRLVSVAVPEVAVVYADEPERIEPSPGCGGSRMAGTLS